MEGSLKYPGLYVDGPLLVPSPINGPASFTVNKRWSQPISHFLSALIVVKGAGL